MVPPKPSLETGTVPTATPSRSATDLDERIDSHDGHVGLSFGVVHQVEIHKLLELRVAGLHAVDDIREEGAATNNADTNHQSERAPIETQTHNPPPSFVAHFRGQQGVSVPGMIRTQNSAAPKVQCCDNQVHYNFVCMGAGGDGICGKLLNKKTSHQ